jgi:phosphoribosylamine--glycine ligase
MLLVQVISFCREKGVDFVLVGPEQPLVEGLVDALAEAGITAFGPTAAAAQLEGSKAFMKDICRSGRLEAAQAQARFVLLLPCVGRKTGHHGTHLCRKHNIPTAQYETFTNPADAKAFIRQCGAPIVVKTSGLAAGAQCGSLVGRAVRA